MRAYRNTDGAAMREKYDLKEMLEDIESDEQSTKPLHTLVSQEEIKRMLGQKGERNAPSRNGHLEKGE